MTKTKETSPKEYLQKFTEESRKMRSVEAINEDIRKTKKGLRNAERKRTQCKLKLAELYKELKEKEK